MKTIKNLTVEVTYRVLLCDVEVSDEVYKGLDKIYDNGGEISDDEANMSGDDNILSAFDWLGEEIKECDAMSCEYEIENFE